MEIFGSAIFEAGTTFDEDSQAYTYFESDSNETITTGGAYIYWLTFDGDGSWTLQDDLSVDSYMMFYVGTVYANGYNVRSDEMDIYSTIYMGSGNWTVIGGNDCWYVDEGAVIVPGTSTIIMDNTFLGSDEYQVFTGGEHTYYNIKLTGVRPTNHYFFINDSNTFNDFKICSPPQKVLFQSLTITTVTTFTARGEAGKYIVLNTEEGE